SDQAPSDKSAAKSGAIGSKSVETYAAVGDMSPLQKSPAIGSKPSLQKSPKSGLKSPAKKPKPAAQLSPTRRSQRNNPAPVRMENQKCSLMDITGKKQVVAE
ncbi:hypothetical protein AALP_AAs41002U000100, partial [Arabis alpina]